MLGLVFKVSTLRRSRSGILVVGPFGPFAKPVRKIVQTLTRPRYTLVRSVRSVWNVTLPLCLHR